MRISDGMLYGLCSAMVTMGVSVTTVLYASETGMPVWAGRAGWPGRPPPVSVSGVPKLSVM